MERLKAIITKLAGFHPPLLPSCLALFLFGGLTLLVITAGEEPPLPAPLVYLLYLCAAISLVLTVQAVVQIIRGGHVRAKLDQLLHRTELTSKLADDWYFRTIAGTYASLAVNLVFVAVKGVVGWLSGSYWLITFACYYLLLSMMRLLLLQTNRRIRKLDDPAERLQREWRTCRSCGIVLIALTVVLEGVVVLIMIGGNHFEYSGYLIYAVALYDFYCLFSAVRYMFKTRELHAPLITALKTVSLVCALVSILSLQTAMFASFGDDMAADMQNRMNLATGSAVCLITLFTGILMVRKSAVGCRETSDE